MPKEEMLKGSINKESIIKTLDQHYFKDLDKKWKYHLQTMFGDIKDNDLIRVRYYDNRHAKPDIVISACNRSVNVTIKTGHAPSIHNESITTFITFLKNINIPDNIISIIKFYHYGVSSSVHTNGTIYNREEILDKYPHLINEASNYFSTHKEKVKKIIYRSIIRGKTHSEPIDYFYYGNVYKGFLLSKYDILDFITSDNNSTCKSLHFCQLVYQPCSRDISKKGRHSMKISWPILCLKFYDEKFNKRYGYIEE